MRDLFGRSDGPAPYVDLAHEKSAGLLVRALIRDGIATAVHDCSDGGLGVALAEMAMASGIGATIEEPGSLSSIASFFGEDQGRYVVTVKRDALNAMLERSNNSGVSAALIGATGGNELKLGSARPILVSDLKSAHESWFPGFMHS
jgi:phosphoribosylformylglycinamidine synthase subunit PurL